MHACRNSTLRLIQDLTTDEWRRQAHHDFSPIGWHLGHIAFTESLWLLEHLQRSPCAYPQYQKLFAADGLPKAERENLPDLTTILHFMADIRDRALAYLETAPLDRQLRLWRWLLQHESQHAETATYLLTMHRWSPTVAPSTPDVFDSSPLPPWGTTATDGMVFVQGGNLQLGRQTIDALDNEQPPYAVDVHDFWIDQTPVTVAEYAEFMAAGGYHNSQWWHPEGWLWRQRYKVTQPLYWPSGAPEVTSPVCGVSWYEADAYACFVGKRLPTEAEWERAARWHPKAQTMQSLPWGNESLSDRHGNFGGGRGGVTPVGQYPAGRSATGCDDLLGNVWEWTSTWFEGYPGFQAFPYKGYSQTYFDRAHRVLRGGSWATRPWVLRPTFRNWYYPHVQQIFAGFRCVLGT
ncbi:MAG: ergothioneine biosynthesis protein EgtB [Leptolyngbya sp. SIOISBB]|nr:ergothioneine biosynthesis protein EgtB [Leptolyngbya sp. SIOISBB]